MGKQKKSFRCKRKDFFCLPVLNARITAAAFLFIRPFDSHQVFDIEEPQGYLKFLNLMENAALIVTDSGGIQEETTFLQIPCLTFRDSTERPVTVELGTNQLLADLNPATVDEKVGDILRGQTKQGIVPPYWDGQAAGRIAAILSRL